ncbi:dihydroneopterin triphosphate diphosphatase [Pasteurella skyensis]|uniref:Dihydroneopterin triphosphate diphosphatase n=1 Tax=Phocoenobacter skyensis TaxID=97481 RepID=A0AAJ6NZQ6_9PAST|nr:dihydroneopterin triphosphate diphosphatase [Pasteurella skyensis]MDP8161612.1 dihydroneopterin triphosphate diphosphatase [Pasteurella skyensis]MDP8171768.1 dihydroneopterin triphosphate diphosphatase [Pasteurella skyensis]MDP8176006.1 dihydroneopterin triphosphate diphosphatase [Pasteurella skyensis]MDP8177974.1 dihydroneopterin triphosphate diphosphatase [Pasteurella skyensis]MDP8182367.1 dihydroneopterin triphosphate diphosphatase [Pasteurella skyensis]
MAYKNNQSVLVVIYATTTNRVLMLQRQDDPTFWQSVTGTIETGEQPFQTALREVKEETGIDIIAQNLSLYDTKKSFKFEIFPQFRYKYAPNVTHFTEHWFLLALEHEIAPILTEHLAFQWLNINDAIQLTKSPNNAQAIQQFLNQSN